MRVDRLLKESRPIFNILKYKPINRSMHSSDDCLGEIIICSSQTNNLLIGKFTPRTRIYSNFFKPLHNYYNRCCVVVIYL